MRYAYIASQWADYPIGFMRRMLEVSRSGCFASRVPALAPHCEADAPRCGALVQARAESRRRYARRRLTHALHAQGWCVNAKRVRRVMREEGLQGGRKGRFVPRTTDSVHLCVIAPNILQRRFAVDTAAPAWESEITYVATQEGRLYVAGIIAVLTREVLGYSFSDRLPDEVVLNALRNACHLAVPQPGTQFHSDRGSQYASDDFREALGALGMVASRVAREMAGILRSRGTSSQH